jgi:hypothetical protein
MPTKNTGEPVMRAIVLLGALSLLAGCSLDAFRSKPLQAPGGGSQGVSGRPEEVMFLSGLGVKLKQMTRTATGLYWRDLAAGPGTEATPGSVAVSALHGWLQRPGFDSSRDRGSVLSPRRRRGRRRGMKGLRACGSAAAGLVIPPARVWARGAARAIRRMPPSFSRLMVAVQGPAQPLADSAGG